ncbi:unnamed protein product [Toxocara canis]|uniref:Uncharacterized protein n=1 Tax=Toxocara canis TaxID=6265 RepID=A0A3P7IQR4_TOXCA|nr:unnamed protein product [Toxocara canis]
MTRPAVIEVTDVVTTNEQPEPSSTDVSFPCERRNPEEAQPSTSTSESVAHSPIFIVERPKLERNSSTRKSI